MQIGDRIKILRESNNMSQVELADAIGVSKQTMYKYENGIITNIPSDKIERLSQVFSVSPAYIMGWTSSALSRDSLELLDLYSKLDDGDQSKIKDFMRVLLSDSKYEKREIANA